MFGVLKSMSTICGVAPYTGVRRGLKTQSQAIICFENIEVKKSFNKNHQLHRAKNTILKSCALTYIFDQPNFTFVKPVLLILHQYFLKQLCPCRT